MDRPNLYLRGLLWRTRHRNFPTGTIAIIPETNLYLSAGHGSTCPIGFCRQLTTEQDPWRGIGNMSVWPDSATFRETPILGGAHGPDGKTH